MIVEILNDLLYYMFANKVNKNIRSKHVSFSNLIQANLYIVLVSFVIYHVKQIKEQCVDIKCNAICLNSPR